jgi:hypothetical protein
MVERVTITKKVRSKKAISSFFLSFLILYILLTQVDMKRTFELARGVSIPIFFLSFLSVYFSIFVRVIRWRELLKNTGYIVGLVELYEIFFLAWFANCLVPAKLGDVYRGYLLKKSRNMSASGVLGTVFVERTIDTIFIVLLVFAAGIYIFGESMPGNIRLSLKIGVSICLLLVLTLWFLRTQKKMFRYFPGRVESVLLTFEEGTSASLTRASLPWILFLTVVIWILEGIRLLLVLEALSVVLPFSIIMFVALGASFLTSIPLTPAGLGVVEASMAGLFVFFGIEKDLAVSVALMDRLLSYWSILILGGVLYAVSKRT